jgi:hypothetical protein
MTPSVSTPIDRVLDVVKALRESAEARIEKAAEQPSLGVSWVWRAIKDHRQFVNVLDNFADAYDNFQEERDTMATVTVDLKRYDYKDPDFSFIDAAGKKHLHAAGIRDLHLELCSARGKSVFDETPDGLATKVDHLRNLEQALLKAQKWLKAQKQPKRKRKRTSDKPRKPRPLTATETETIQIVGECKGNVAAAARRLGKDRKTVEESYRTGLGKLGKEAYRYKTRLLPRDKRGQEVISDDSRG